MSHAPPQWPNRIHLSEKPSCMLIWLSLARRRKATFGFHLLKAASFQTPNWKPERMPCISPPFEPRTHIGKLTVIVHRASPAFRFAFILKYKFSSMARTFWVKKLSECDSKKKKKIYLLNISAWWKWIH